MVVSTGLIKPSNKLRKLFLAAVVSAPLFANTAFAVEQNGAAIYSVLDKPQYIVSLSSAEGTNPDSLDGKQQIKFVILNSKLSPRKWKKQWNNNININNDFSALSAETQDHIGHFLSFPDSKLSKGDTVLLSFDPETGTKVTFNGHGLIQQNGSEFYSVIKNTLTGKFAPSREFRDQVLGNKAADSSSTDLLALTPDPSRVKSTTSWVITSEALEAQKKEKERLARIAREKKIAAEKAKAARLAAIAKKKAEEKRKAEEAKRLKLAAEKKARLKKEAEAKKKQEARAKKARLAAEKRKKQQEQYERDMYQYNMTQMLYGRIQYPTWARKFEIEGEVDLVATINRSGEIENVVHNNDVDKKLSKEVMTRIEEVAGELQYPAASSSESIQFPFRYIFSLRKKDQPEITKPVAIK